MAIQTRTVEYRDGDTVLEAVMAWDDSVNGARPGILVSHAWSGRSEFESDKAIKLAELGYVGFALDMYGKGIRGNSVEENTALMTPFLEDRGMLLSRIQTAVDALSQQPEADGSQIAAIGFCFGGLCVLDLARGGASIKGVVSFHGLLNPPESGAKTINAKILCLHGYADPMAPPDSVVALGKELTEAGADWQLHAYGNTMHSFTNPEANDADSGTVYNAIAEARSWQSMVNFFEELFS